MSVPHDGLPCEDCGGQLFSRLEEKDGVQTMIMYCPACERKAALDAVLSEQEALGVEPKEFRDE